MTIAGISEIVRNTFGLWITALFDAILVPNPTLTFEQHREAFFLAYRETSPGRPNQTLPAKRTVA